MNRVEMHRAYVGTRHMSVCCDRWASDEEILAFCNKENPAGTELGWHLVLRADSKETYWFDGKTAPMPCDEYKARLHVLVRC